MSKAFYTWNIIEDNVLAIVDLFDECEMAICKSVTNDMENVIADIKKECTTLPVFPKIIVYLDTNQLWDGWDDEKQDFIICSVGNMDDAIKMVKEYYEKKTDSSRS